MRPPADRVTMVAADESSQKTGGGSNDGSSKNNRLPQTSADDKLLLACCRAIRKESGWQERTLRQACDWATGALGGRDSSSEAITGLVVPMRHADCKHVFCQRQIWGHMGTPKFEYVTVAPATCMMTQGVARSAERKAVKFCPCRLFAINDVARRVDLPLNWDANMHKQISPVKNCDCCVHVLHNISSWTTCTSETFHRYRFSARSKARTAATHILSAASLRRVAVCAWAFADISRISRLYCATSALPSSTCPMARASVLSPRIMQTLRAPAHLIDAETSNFRCFQILASCSWLELSEEQLLIRVCVFPAIVGSDTDE